MISLSYYTMWSVKFSSDHNKTQCWFFFSKMEPRFMPLSIFHLTHILLLMMKMQIFFICEKLEQRVDPLKVLLLCFRKLQQTWYQNRALIQSLAIYTKLSWAQSMTNTIGECLLGLVASCILSSSLNFELKRWCSQKDK